VEVEGLDQGAGQITKGCRNRVPNLRGAGEQTKEDERRLVAVDGEGDPMLKTWQPQQRQGGKNKIRKGLLRTKTGGQRKGTCNSTKHTKKKGDKKVNVAGKT